MNDKRVSDQIDHIGRLLRLAGPRPAAPHDREARVRESVRLEWRTAVRERRRRRWLVGSGIGLAAAALVAIFGVVDRSIGTPEVLFDGPVGFVETVAGTVRVRPGADGAEQILRVGDVVKAGSVIDTGTLGRAALRLVSGSSLRLDRGTRLLSLTGSKMSLERGAVYFDSGGDDSGGAVEIRTPLGVVYDVGTQFEVRLEDELLRVRVREGAVNVDRDGQRYDAGAGVELTVGTGGAHTRRSVPRFGPGWDWILAVAPTFDLEGRTLDAFLQWVKRETGWSPRFVDPEAQAGAPEVVLHGSIAGMRPDQALEAVLPTCGLAHRIDSGILVIQAEGP